MNFWPKDSNFHRNNAFLPPKKFMVPLCPLNVLEIHNYLYNPLKYFEGKFPKRSKRIFDSLSPFITLNWVVVFSGQRWGKRKGRRVLASQFLCGWRLWHQKRLWNAQSRNVQLGGKSSKDSKSPVLFGFTTFSFCFCDYFDQGNLYVSFWMV